MDHHLPIVAAGFRIAGLVFGIPSLILLVCLVWAWISIQGGPQPVDGSAGTSISSTGVVGLLVAGARVMGKAFGAFSALTSWAIALLSGVAFATVLLSAALFFTGRGLQAHAMWARVTGGVLSGIVLAISLLALLSMRRSIAIVPAVPLSASIYTLWVLIRKFS